MKPATTKPTSTHRTARVLCVDDHAFLVEGLRAKIEAEEHLEFAGSLSTLDNVCEEVEQAGAQIVLLDIEIPGPDVFDVIEDLHARVPHVKAVILSAYVRDHYIDSAVHAGAWGYLSKSDDPGAIIEGLCRVAHGEFAFGPEIMERMQTIKRRPTAAAAHSPSSKLHALTPREQQILRMIGRGQTRTEIAKVIHRSPKTVDAHRASIMEKLCIHDRVELARYAIREGLVEV